MNFLITWKIYFSYDKLRQKYIILLLFLNFIIIKYTYLLKNIDYSLIIAVFNVLTEL